MKQFNKINLTELSEKELQENNGGFFPGAGLYYRGVYKLAKYMWDNKIDVSGANYWNHGR